MSCFGCASKLFLILNFLLLGLAIAVVTIGAVLISSCSSYSELLHYGFLSVPIWVLVIGILLLLLSFYGISAGYSENTCLLYTYATFLSIFFLIGSILLIYIAVEHQEVDERLKEELYEVFEDYGIHDEEKQGNKSELLDQAIDNLQQELQCCGIDEFSDWYNMEFGSVPQSCCLNVTICTIDSLNPTGIFEIGCYQRVTQDLSGTSLALLIVSIFLVIIQGICLCLACGLSTAINRYHYV